MAQSIGVWIFTVGRKCTKLADIFADIGRVDMTIYIEKSLVAMPCTTPHVGIMPKREKVKLV